MSRFKFGDIVISDTGWIAKVERVNGIDNYALTLMEAWRDAKKGYSFSCNNWDAHLSFYVYRSLQERVIEKIQWLYKNSPSSFEKRWVKNES